ncbi:UNVERIFIED_CONTAM: biotin/lipoyl-binding protein, partial [Prevotella sp. 15_C9]
IEGSGVTAAKKREELGREVKGKVTQVLVAEGDEVHTGDPLLVIDPTETRKELADAQKELTEAERGVSDAQLEVSKAQSDLSAAQR